MSRKWGNRHEQAIHIVRQVKCFMSWIQRNGKFKQDRILYRTSLLVQTIKRLTTMWEIRVQSLGQEDLLEKEMATHSSILAWKIPWMEETGRLQSMGLQRVRHDSAISLH